jgi:BON domain
MTTDNLRTDVVAELSWDPQVDSTRIAVSTEGGRVILRGPVSSVIPATVDARAAGGVVTLSGTAIWQHPPCVTEVCDRVVVLY